MTEGLIQQPKTKPILFSLLTLLSGIAIGVGMTLIFVNQKTPNPAESSPVGITDRTVGLMMHELNLPEEKRQEIWTIVFEHMAEIDKIRREAEEPITAIINEMNAEIYNTLDPEQQEAWAERVKRMQENFERMGRRGGGRQEGSRPMGFRPEGGRRGGGPDINRREWPRGVGDPNSLRMRQPWSPGNGDPNSPWLRPRWTPGPGDPNLPWLRPRRQFNEMPTPPNFQQAPGVQQPQSWQWNQSWQWTSNWQWNQSWRSHQNWQQTSVWQWPENQPTSPFGNPYQIPNFDQQ